MTQKIKAVLALAIALALFVGINMFSGVALRFVRADMTEHDLFTLSEGTREILADLEEPITLRFFYSTEVGTDHPRLETYHRRVRELLEEFVNAADGKIVLQVIDPEPYSEAEELATSYGIRGQLADAAGSLLFFGLAGTNAVDDLETIPAFNQVGESTLEYELAKLVNDLATPEKSKVAILSGVNLQGGPAMMPGQPPAEAWGIVEALRESFDVEFLDASSMTAEVAEDVDVMMVVHPTGLPETAQFAIDQFALRGGKVLALVDAYFYLDPMAAMQQNQFGGGNRTSQLDTLLGAWGVELVPSQVAGDPALAMQVPLRTGVANFPLWMVLNAQIDPHLIAADDFVTSSLNVMNLFCAGALRAKEDGGTTVTPLLSTTTYGQTIDSINLQFARDVMAIAGTIGAQFQDVDDGERVDLAVRVEGPIATAFPDGAPEGWEGTAEVLTESAEPFHAIVVADVDFMHDELWAIPVGFARQSTNNPTFVINAVENLCGSTSLLSVRGRGVVHRPFEKKEELTKLAQERFMAKDQELQAKEQELMNEIRELQKGADEEGVVRMTMQQFQELGDKQQEQIEIRRERGRVKHELRKDIETLGSRLKLINIGLVPALVAAGGIAFHLTRRRRRSA